MQKVSCPPCGPEFVTHDDGELAEIVQKHARRFHQNDVPRGEILKSSAAA